MTIRIDFDRTGVRFKNVVITSRASKLVLTSKFDLQANRLTVVQDRQRPRDQSQLWDIFYDDEKRSIRIMSVANPGLGLDNHNGKMILIPYEHCLGQRWIYVGGFLFNQTKVLAAPGNSNRPGIQLEAIDPNGQHDHRWDFVQCD